MSESKGIHRCHLCWERFTGTGHNMRENINMIVAVCDGCLKEWNNGRRV